MNNSRNVVIISESPLSEEQLEREEKKNFLLKYSHQIIALALIHISFIIFQGLNAFEKDWASALIYALIAVGTMAFILLQRKKYFYLIPIPFISLIINAAVLLNTITITAIFFAYIIFFFVLLFLEKKSFETIFTIISSGITLFLLTVFTLFDGGFVKVNYELNVVTLAWLVWFAISTTLTFLQKKKFSITLTYAITSIVISAIAPCLTPEGTNSNVFIILCFILILVTAVSSLVMIFLENNYDLSKFLGINAIAAIGIVIFSYTFNIFFGWIPTGLTKALIVDYGLFIPIALFTIGFLFWKMYKQSNATIGRVESFSKETNENDGILLGVFFLLIFFSQIMNIFFVDYNLIKGLIISIIVLAASVPLNLRISSIFSILGVTTFLGLVLGVLGNLDREYVLIILMSLSTALLIFAVINELFLLKEPLTTALSISGSITLMLSMFIYFDFLSLYIDIIWAGISLYLFTIGIIFNKIFLRRTGLTIIILDIIYTIIHLLIEYRSEGWILGIGFMVIAVVLIGCIFLFRWSEKKHKTTRTQEQNDFNK